ncbi:MAG: membrane or secreted protein [Croceitalea sp.]|nr:membrane or secreted protein [Croceitalea sp.]
MTKLFPLLLLFFSVSLLSAQSLVGAWETIKRAADGTKQRNVVVFTDGFQVSTWFNADTGAFIGANGGLWKRHRNKITETVEFDSQNPERVGKQIVLKIELEDSILRVKKDNMAWKRIDAGSPGALAGAWLMSGRKRDGEIQTRDTSRPRKTMKILSGTRFQWIAYNTETKEFSGTGGGTYTTLDGKYTEKIEFFSRDDSRVGASLVFDFNLDIKNGDWHLSGLSSKGDPIFEIWSPRAQ